MNHELLLCDLKETTRHWKLKEEALYCTLWRNRFGKGCGHVMRQTEEWMMSYTTRECRMHTLRQMKYTLRQIKHTLRQIKYTLRQIKHTLRQKKYARSRCNVQEQNRFCTWTLDSGRLILRATSSLMKMSGYRVFSKSASRTSSCARVNVVLSRRCLRGLPARSILQPKKTNIKISIDNSARCICSCFVQKQTMRGLLTED